MELMHPDTGDTDEAMEGDASHELGATMIASMSRANSGFPAREVTVGACATNGWVWDDASYEGALMYAEDVREVMIRTAVFTPQIEQPVDIGCINGESWGTDDCDLYDAVNKTLYIWDYKYGHRVVEAAENWQMIEYAAGILDEMDTDGIEDQTITIVMTIVQPRAFHRRGTVRRWTVKASDLRGHFNRLVDVEAAALGSDPITQTGTECVYCSARHVCETLQRASGGAMHYLGLPTPAPLSASALSTELHMVQDAYTIIKARKSGLEAQAEGIIAQGEVVPGYAVEAGKGRQCWTLTPAEVFSMGDLIDIDLRKASVPITPKQAIAAGIDASVIKGYSKTPSTAATLVESSKTAAHAVFAKR